MDENAPSLISIATLDDRPHGINRQVLRTLSSPLIILYFINSSFVVVILLAQETLALLQTPLSKPNH